MPCGFGTRDTIIGPHNTKVIITIWYIYTNDFNHYSFGSVFLHFPFIVDLQIWESTKCPDIEASAVEGASGYADIEYAHRVCAMDDNCYGIIGRGYDTRCVNRPPYKICKTKYKLKSRSDCTHAKIGNRL